MVFTSLFRSLKRFSQTSFNILDSYKRVGGGGIVVGWGAIVVEEEGVSMLEISIAAGWFGAIKGSSWTNSKTNDADESRVAPVWIVCSSSALEFDAIMKSGSGAGWTEDWG